MNENAGKYATLTREVARQKIVADLEEAKLLDKVEPYVHKVGHNSRSGTVIEPMLSTQWFVKTETLAKVTIQTVKNKEIEFFPLKWEKTFFDWMYNIHDWCISRQLWWGHRIPVWYDEQDNMYVWFR